MVTPMQLFLAGDDHVCVFCGHVSATGVLAELGPSRFFACATCLSGVIERLATTQDHPGRIKTKLSRNNNHVCVCCGQARAAGWEEHEGTNWFFLCSACARDVVPTMLDAWAGFRRGSRAFQRQRVREGWASPKKPVDEEARGRHPLSQRQLLKAIMDWQNEMPGENPNGDDQ